MAPKYQAPFKMSSSEKNKLEEIKANLRQQKLDIWLEEDGEHHEVNFPPPDPDLLQREAFDYWLRWKIKTDLFFFGNEIMEWRFAHSRYLMPGTTRLRYRVDPDLHRWLCKLLMSEDDTLILIPRLHLKSTWVKLRIMQLVLNDPNIRIGLFSVTARLVEKELADIKRMFCHPVLLRLFPEQIPKPGKEYKNWDKSTINELTLRRDKGVTGQQEQITAVGMGASITGMHFDIAFLDDVIDDEVVESQTLMRKAEDWWAYLQPILETESTTIITGTPYHYNDLYAKIIREKQFGSRVFMRANVELGKPIYRSWYTLPDFEKMRKRLGAYKYSCQMECNPVPEADKLFPPPQPTFDPPLPADVKGYRWYCLIDPAASVEQYSNYTAFSIQAINHLGQVFVVESFAVKRGSEEIADILIRFHLRYKFNAVGVEAGLQAHLEAVIRLKVREWERDHKEKLHLVTIPIPIKKQSKRLRIDANLGALVRTGRTKISCRCTRLLRQMDLFTGKEGDEDDEIDAASMIVYVADIFPQHYTIEKELREQGMTWDDFFKKKKRRGWEASFKHAS